MMAPGATAATLEDELSSFPDGFADAAGVVHDLGNLIQIVASALNIIARSPGPSQDAALAPVMERARTALERAGALVQQTKGKVFNPTLSVRAKQDAQSLSACLNEIVALISWVCEPDIVLSMEAPADLPLIRCNRTELQSAVLNLVINARDAMPDGGSLRIIASRVDDGLFSGTVELSVMDDGSGMSRETLARAFTPYFTTKADDRGMGLGLAMVRRFAHECGGRVGIVSAPGVGTAVTLRLPAEKPCQARPAAYDGDPPSSFAD